MGKGWISIHRKITEHWLWENDKPFDKRSAWIDILLMVSHEKKKVLLGNEIIEVDRGERVTSERKLAERWGWSRTKVRNFLELLVKDKMIEIKQDKQKTILKVLNYGKYQQPKNHERTTENEQNERINKKMQKIETSKKTSPNYCYNNDNQYIENQQKNHKKTTREPQENHPETQTIMINNGNNDNKKNIRPNSKSSDDYKLKFSPDDGAYRATRYLIKRIQKNNKRARTPEEGTKLFDKWATEMDRLNRLGPPGGSEGQGYSWSEIKKLIDWCQDHHFWSGVILSASNFREKIVKLENQMKNERKKSKPKKYDDIDLSDRAYQPFEFD